MESQEEAKHTGDMLQSNVTRPTSNEEIKDALSAGNAQKKRNRSSPNESDKPIKKVKREPGLNTATTFTRQNDDSVNSHIESSQSFSEVSKGIKRAASVDETCVLQTKKCKPNTADCDKIRPKKRTHRRMKSLLQAVLNQMEFYFGNSNLTKDRYLRQLIDVSPDGYVDLHIFGNFNKLQSLHKDGVSLNVLVKALKRSKMLQVNEEQTKVKRITPIKEISPEELDSQTVYVEDLPATATHQWIQTIFSQCGKVTYVSLPTYKTTKQVKGFAFVEFETVEEAAKACSMLNKPRPVKSEEKPGKFPKWNKTLSRLHWQAGPIIDQTSSEKSVPEEENVVEVSEGKRKKKTKKGKRMRPQDSDDTTGKQFTSQVEQTQREKKKRPENLDDATGKQSTCQGDQTHVKRKKKKKKRKHAECADGACAVHEDKTVQVVSSELDKTGDKPQVSESSKMEVEDSKIDEKFKVENIGVTKMNDGVETSGNDAALKKKKKKKKKKRKGDKRKQETTENDTSKKEAHIETGVQTTEGLSLRKLKKRQRQEDIRRRKLLLAGEKPDVSTNDNDTAEKNLNTSEPAEATIERTNDPVSVTVDTIKMERKVQTAGHRRSDGSELTSILKSNKTQERKKVDFDPVPVTTEFIKGREIRKRKKAKKEELHLRVIAKKEWLALKAEYISRQKSHMSALKESLRELRQQENQLQGESKLQNKGHVNLEDVFGTKRLKPSQDVKMAHVESLKFIPNVIVQWNCLHEMHRDKIKSMFKEHMGNQIAYIDAAEEAKSGYIRFKDEASAEEFTRLSRCSTSFFARVLPADQQQAYWDKANEDRKSRLARKQKEKGSEKIARKVFARNMATFHQKSNHVIFNDEEEDKSGREQKEVGDDEGKKSKESTVGMMEEASQVPNVVVRESEMVES